MRGTNPNSKRGPTAHGFVGFATIPKRKAALKQAVMSLSSVSSSGSREFEIPEERDSDAYRKVLNARAVRGFISLVWGVYDPDEGSNSCGFIELAESYVDAYQRLLEYLACKPGEDARLMVAESCGYGR